MNGPYINEKGDLWIERGTAPWPKVRRAAGSFAWEISDSGKVRYLGIQSAIRVSDLHDAGGLHYDDDGCADSQGIDYNDPAFVPCCRTIEAYHFQAVEA